MVAGREDRSEWIAAALEAYELPLVRYAVRLTGDLETARDVVQDTFMRLWSADREAVGDHLAQWLYTVCRNRALDVVRKERRMIPWRDAPTATPEAVASGTVAVAAERGAATDEVLAALARLPERDQEMVRLKFLDGLTYKQIAGVTGAPIGTVGYVIHTALAELRTLLADPPGAPRARKEATQ